MKSSWFIFLFIFIFPYLTSAQILITEVMYNPRGNDNDREWFEAINLGSDLEVLTGKNGWRIYDGKNRLIKEESFIWENNEVIVFVQDKNKFLAEYPQINCRLAESSFVLKNKEGEIKILDKNKNTLAEFRYSSSLGGNGNDYSLVFGKGIIKEGSFKKGTPCIYPEPLDKQIIESKENVLTNENIQTTTVSSYVNLKEEPQAIENFEEKKEISQQKINEAQEPKYSSLLITEFFPNPKGRDDNEFVEIYNEGDDELDLSKIILQVGNKSYKFFGRIKPKEFKVFYKKEFGFNIRNKGEELALRLENGEEIFYVEYANKAPEDKSFSRNEKGKWGWTIPTPGKVNIFEKENEEENLSYFGDDKILAGNKFNEEKNFYEVSQHNKPVANIFSFTNLKILLLGFLLALIISSVVIYFLK